MNQFKAESKKIDWMITLVPLVLIVGLCALFMVIPIALYSGQRGKAMKLAPYLFYPVHLLVFSLVCVLLKL